MFKYRGKIARVRLIPHFPSTALRKLSIDATWAAQALIISNSFQPEGEPWISCCDLDSDPCDPNIYLEVVMGGAGPITLKNPKGKEVLAAQLLPDDYKLINWNSEETFEVTFSCRDIFTKQVKGKDYLRRHVHPEKGGRLLWNLAGGKLESVEVYPNSTTNDAPDLTDEPLVTPEVAQALAL
jgi:hypothetical protein